MRTTVRLDDALLLEAKHEAARLGTTLTALIDESLRERLARSAANAEPRPRVRLTTTGHGGLLPGVDLDDSASLLDLMEGTE